VPASDASVPTDPSSTTGTGGTDNSLEVIRRFAETYAQRTGTYLLRQEDGLGEGLLITGHHSGDPSVEGTWGPLPLDLFAA